MKVLGFVGSPRKNGNTDILVKTVLDGVSSCGIGTEIIYLSDLDFDACTGCEGCRDSLRCVKNDGMHEVYDKLEAAEGIVLGSPTYFYNISSLVKAFIERLYCFDVFDPEDRSVWVSLGELKGSRYAVSVTVCEQKEIADMGCASDVMDRSLRAVGYRVVESLKALHLFKKGECREREDILREAYAAGVKLGKTILLASKAKEMLKQ
ncbi:MAG: flavodoxin family protein [Clostridia bacterium]|nr:flavodoxin family protein [Clostridia bacterium]